MRYRLGNHRSNYLGTRDAHYATTCESIAAMCPRRQGRTTASTNKEKIQDG
jgi:hypothetical protein